MEGESRITESNVLSPFYLPGRHEVLKGHLRRDTDVLSYQRGQFRWKALSGKMENYSLAQTGVHPGAFVAMRPEPVPD